MRVKKIYLYSVFSSVFVYLFTSYFAGANFSENYEASSYFNDQEKYINIWNLIQNKNFFDAFAWYKSKFASQEIVHFFYIHFTSLIGLTKNVSMSLANSIIVFFLLNLIYKHFKPSIFVIILIVSNSYLFSYFFVLERMKFAMLFFVLMMYFYENQKLRFVFFTLSFLSHFSLLILYVIFYISKFNDKKFFFNFNFKYKEKNLNNNYFLFLFIILFMIFFYDHLIIKSHQLFHSNYLLSIINSLKVLVFLILTFLVSKKNNIEEILIQFIPLIFASYIIEPSRIVSFAFFLFIYHCIKNKDNKISTPLMISSLIYFSFKTLYRFI